jgi:hypothetical protein
MINPDVRLKALAALGKWMQEDLLNDDALLQQVYYNNRWFTAANTRQSISAIAEYFLDKAKLNRWLKAYTLHEPATPKRVGIIAAGNLPLVCFHDMLCVLVSGNVAVVKLSSKDKLLLPHITAQLLKIEPQFKQQIVYADFLKQIDAVIATGGNNSSRYFEYYFAKYPHIIRKNRNSVAVLTGNETDDELKALGKDVFQYFGLGCRNVSMLLVPKDYVFNRLFENWETFSVLMNEDTYKNNYDYNRTLLLMNKVEHLSNDAVMLRKSPLLSSPISCVHYTVYNNIEVAEKFIAEHADAIQCVVSSGVIPNSLPFGRTQNPELWDYADGVDTMKFLVDLN